MAKVSADAGTHTTADEEAPLLRRVALEALRAALVATHAAGALCREARLRSSERAARCAEGLLRSAVALAVAPPAPPGAAAAPRASSNPEKGKTDKKDKKKKKRRGKHKEKGKVDKDDDALTDISGAQSLDAAPQSPLLDDWADGAAHAALPRAARTHRALAPPAPRAPCVRPLLEHLSASISSDGR